MSAAEQMHQAAPPDAVGHDGRNLFNVCGLCFPDTIESFSNAFTKLDSAQNTPPAGWNLKLRMNTPDLLIILRGWYCFQKS